MKAATLWHCHAAQLPPAAPLHCHGSSTLRIVLPALYLCAITMRKCIFSVHALFLTGKCRSGFLYSTVLKRMERDCLFLPGLWAAIKKQHFKMEGASETPSVDSKEAAPRRQGFASLEWQKVFESACIGRGFHFYFVRGRLILYSDLYRVYVIMLIKNDKWFTQQL